MPQKNENIIQVPLLGKVSAGNPIEAIENPDDYKTDMTLGDVFGVNFNSQENEYEKSITNIGFKDAAGFKKPVSQ